jgi:peptidyl-prolyl cis-trans isomerase D
MLQAIRSRASGIIVQILFGLLIITFALWGIGDIFRVQSTDNGVATVGDQKIQASEVADALRHQVERLRQATNASLTEEQIKQLGLPRNALNEVINQHLLDLEAQHLGLAINDDAVRQEIINNPAFRGSSGQFSRDLYRQVLAANQMTDQQFEALLRTDLVRNRIVATVTDGAGAPNELVDALWQSRGERRTATAVLIPPSAVGVLPTPDAGTLEAFYDAHKDDFLLPERRSFTVALIDPAQYAADIKIPEDELEAAYKKRLDQFAVPEKRELQQILVPDEAKAKAVEAALAQGKNFATVAHDVAGQSADSLNLGTLTQDEMPGQLGEAAFALKSNGITPPIKDAFGWHILKLISVTPGKVAPFDSVKAKLASELALDRAIDKVANITNAVNDALAAGSTFPEIVNKFHLKTITLDSVDAEGRDSSGKQIKLPAPGILKTAFGSPLGPPHDVKDLPDQGSYMVAVNKVIPAAPQPLAQIRDKVVAAWQEQERNSRLAKLAEDYANAINKGQKLDELAALHGLKPFTTKPLSRNTTNAELPPIVVAKLFGAKPGQAVTGSAGSKGVIVAALVKILPPDPATAAAEKAAIRREIEQATGADLLSEYEQSLRQRFPVQEAKDALDKVM